MRILSNGDPKKKTNRFDGAPAFTNSMFPDSYPQGEIPEGYMWDGSSLTPRDWEEGHGDGELDLEKLYSGVSRVESANGQLMFSPSSTATGLFGQLFSEIDEMPELKGVSREQFGADKELQKKIFDMRIDKGLRGAPSLRRNAEELTEEYASQLGDKWEFPLDEVAAISNYLGRGGAREYFAALRDGKEYRPSGVNKTVDQYLEIYRREK